MYWAQERTSVTDHLPDRCEIAYHMRMDLELGQLAYVARGRAGAKLAGRVDSSCRSVSQAVCFPPRSLRGSASASSSCLKCSTGRCHEDAPRGRGPGIRVGDGRDDSCAAGVSDAHPRVKRALVHGWPDEEPQEHSALALGKQTWLSPRPQLPASRPWKLELMLARRAHRGEQTWRLYAASASSHLISMTRQTSRFPVLPTTSSRRQHSGPGSQLHPTCEPNLRAQ